jgi:hypothetical protein
MDGAERVGGTTLLRCVIEIGFVISKVALSTELRLRLSGLSASMSVFLSALKCILLSFQPSAIRRGAF